MAAAAAEKERREEFLIEEDPFKRNAFLIIKKMVGLNTETTLRHPELVDEVLHSILFLGHINVPQYTPEKIVSDVDMLNALRGRYPHPFECYSTQLPKRAPISCVLEMIVNLTGQEKEEEIYEKLLKLIGELKEGKTKHLVSNTFCVSQHKICKNPVRYYGVSMSTSGPNPGRVMIAASCLSRYWDSRVAGAVMTYNLSNQKKNPDFDGTIKLPKEVRCQAFKLIQGKEVMPPCKSCSDLFGLTTSDARGWRYGNCAEPESLSRLLEKEKVKVNRTTPFDEGGARKSVLTELTKILRMLHFNWDGQFYTPQD